jgi:glycosyltransferase involved in cell wall biosynthesis
MGAPDRVVVINDDAMERGGAAGVALASARLLAERGIPVTFLSGSAAAEPDPVERGIATVSVSRRQLLARGGTPAALRGLHDPATNAALVNWIEAHDTPRMVYHLHNKHNALSPSYHLHNWHKALSPSVFAGFDRVASRPVIHAHRLLSRLPQRPPFPLPEALRMRLEPNGMRCVMTSCDRRRYAHKLWRVARHALRHRRFDLTTSAARVVAVHEAMVPLLVRGPIAASSIRVLHNPVMPWRTSRVPLENNSDVVFVGRLDGDKGAHLMARAARRVGARLRLIGDGSLAAEIMELYPRAELLGGRSRAEITELIATGRIVVSPTLNREPFGLAPLEALMSGIPVIVSKSSPFAGDIVERKLGLVCDPHDEAALTGTFETLAYDNLLVRRLSLRAMTEARRLAPPTPAQWCDGLLSVYAERLGAPAGMPDTPAYAVSSEAADG